MNIAKTNLFAASVAGVLAAAITPASATIPLSGGLHGIANAVIGSATATDPDNKDWTGAPSDLSISMSATQTDSFGSLVSTSGSATAHWDSPDSGTVDFLDYGWNVQVLSTTPDTSEADLVYGRAGDDWTYTFTATQNGEISVDFNVSVASGTGFGLQGWQIDWSGDPGTGYPKNDTSITYNPTQSGVFTADLVAGETYTIGLLGNPNINNGPSYLYSYSTYMNGSFSWAIVGSGSTVPEPSTWALLIIGFGGIGLAAGWRRKQALAPQS